MGVSDILSLDIATTTGWARGRVGTAPTFGSINFATRDASDNAIFAAALRWLSGFLDEKALPDLIMIEQMLPPSAMRGRTARAVRDRLAGLEGVLRAVAFCRGCYRIETARVTAVRAHFIGEGMLKRNAAKTEVMRACHRLGWNVANDNEGDACALWHFACSRFDPKVALQASPLFHRGVAI